MPKVFTHDAKGLVQKAGTGIDIDNLESGLRLKHADSGAAITLKAKTEDVTMVNGAGLIQTTLGFVPANSLIVAAAVEIVTASVGGTNRTIDTIGLLAPNGGAADPNYFGAASLSIQALGMKIGTQGDAAAVANEFITVADRITATLSGVIGAQTTAGVARFTLWYYDLSASAAVSNN